MQIFFHKNPYDPQNTCTIYVFRSLQAVIQKDKEKVQKRIRASRITTARPAKYKIRDLESEL
jgi:hypothetical protein